jgi:hypothetical protein
MSWGLRPAAAAAAAADCKLCSCLCYTDAVAAGYLQALAGPRLTLLLPPSALAGWLAGVGVAGDTSM